MAQNIEEKKNWITEGIILATIPLFGYLIGYVFECGYTSYFGIPLEFIEVTIQQILLASIFGISTFLFLTIFIQPFLLSLFAKHPFFRAVAKFFLPWFVFLSFIFPLLLSSENGFFKISIVLLLLVILFFVLVARAFFAKDKSKPFWERAEEIISIFLSSQTREKNSDETLRNDETNIEPKQFFFSMLENLQATLCFVLLTLAFVFGLGAFYASSQKLFWVSQSDSVVLLRKYGEHFLGRKLNRETNTLEKEVLIFKIKDDQKLSIKSENLGEVKIEK